MFQLIIKIICIIMMLIAVLCIFDARKLTKRFFSFGDQNDGTNGLKILGFIIFIIASFIIMIIK